MTHDSKRTLDELLAGLARDIEPPPQLWSGVVRGIHRPHRSSRRWVLAAAVVSACVASTLTWAVLHNRPPAAAAPAMQAARAPNFNEPTNAALLAARAELESTFRERLALLAPATRAKIEANLAVIRQANQEIRQALAAEPANPVLNQLLASTWHDEFDLYDRVVQATQPTQTRT